jgi:hypothetical protein
MQSAPILIYRVWYAISANTSPPHPQTALAIGHRKKETIGRFLLGTEITDVGLFSVSPFHVVPSQHSFSSSNQIKIFTFRGSLAFQICVLFLFGMSLCNHMYREDTITLNEVIT